jgi:hypothetical protein
MGWTGHFGRLASWRCFAARTIVAGLCGVALLIGTLPEFADVATTAPHSAQFAQLNPALLEADHTAQAQHPCKRSALAAAMGSCAVSGASAGLVDSGADVATPILVTMQLPPVSYASLAPQWRGAPPDRPPRS